MHIADPALGIFGANGDRGRRPADRGRRGARGRSCAGRDGSVAVAFFGDGAVGAGRVPRGAEPRRGLAAPGRLLLREQRLRRVLAGVPQHRARSRASRGAGYGIDHVAVDGNDVVAVRAAADAAVVTRRAPATARRCRGATYRWHGHYEGDPERYRSEEEVAEWRGRDPLPRRAAVLGEARAAEIGRRGGRGAQAAARVRAREPVTGPDALLTATRESRQLPRTPISLPRIARGDGARPSGRARRRGRRARRRPVRRHARPARPVRRARVRDTPISEVCLVGPAIGAAMTGAAPDRRDHVPRLRDAGDGPDRQPGGEVASVSAAPSMPRL